MDRHQAVNSDFAILLLAVIFSWLSTWSWYWDVAVICAISWFAGKVNPK
jgi:hypothetical protein